MLDRADIESHREAALAPYAARARDSRGRRHPEAEAPYRGIFQRDRDRIVHCAAFRRLEYKTQVFVSDLEGDHHRNRLTHTMEVTQIARTLARALALNEDLVEALALAHDLGHGPFGHSGEEALNEVMRQHGGFNHNIQGLRVADLFERRYPDFSGLNLTYETREGWTKNMTPELRARHGFARDEAPSLEVQLVGHADEIAYDTHDIEDGLHSKVISEDALRGMDLWRQTEQEVLGEHTALKADKHLRWHAVVRRMIRVLVGDLLAETERRIAKVKVKTLADVRACRNELAGFSKSMAVKKQILEKYLNANFYLNPEVRKHTGLWQERLKDIFRAYVDDPSRLPETHRERVKKEGEELERVVCDYVAGMTDRFAEMQWERYCKK